MDFGIVCEIYSLEQLDEALKFMQKSDNLLFGLDKMADAMQDRDLAALSEREPLDALKDLIQEEYADLPTPNPAWPRLFASVQAEKDLKKLTASWQAFKQQKA